MAENLTEYLRGRKAKRFVPRPMYFPDGDFVSYFLKDERAYARRVDDLLTVYVSMKTDELVGCKIKGVRRLLKKLGEFGVMIDDREGAVLGLLFLAAASLTDDPSQKEEYERIGQKIGSAIIEKGELLAVT
jgi:hypothetical protein